MNRPNPAKMRLTRFMILLPIIDVCMCHSEIFQLRDAVKIERAFRCANNLDRRGSIGSDCLPGSIVPPSGSSQRN
jgi:hypothetical protein